MAAKELPTPEVMRKLIDLDPATGLMTWRKRPVEFCKCASYAKRWNSRCEGKPALNAPKAGGYRHGTVLGRHVLAHRAVWVLLYGQWPVDEIDHIDGNRSNNVPSNLRAATHAQNCMNTTTSASGATSRHVGVSWNKSHKKWVAYISVSGRPKYLGVFETEAEALAVRRAAASTLFGAFAPVWRADPDGTV